MTLQCAAVDGSWELGDRVMVHVGDDIHRQYTICRIHRPRGVFDILAVAHGAGPGGRWVHSAQDGASVRFFGPKPDLDVRTAGVRNIILLGDETTVGLYEAVHRVKRGSVRIWGALEHAHDVTLGDCELPVLSGLEQLARGNRIPGEGLNRWIRANDIHAPQTVFFVNGHGAAVRTLRLALLSLGIRGMAIRSRAFWGRR